MSSGEGPSSSSTNNTEKQEKFEKPVEGMNNVLQHVESLQKERSNLLKELDEAKKRNERLSVKTREGMQSALDTLMKKWMDAVETKDEKVKDQFKCGLEKLVSNSAEDNGVWQMMVAASALHERQEHNLDKLREENETLKTRIDGHYATEDARLGKRKADDQADRESVNDAETGSMWDDFAKSVGSMY